MSTEFNLCSSLREIALPCQHWRRLLAVCFSLDIGEQRRELRARRDWDETRTRRSLSLQACTEDRKRKNRLLVV